MYLKWDTNKLQVTAWLNMSNTDHCWFISFALTFMIIETVDSQINTIPMKTHKSNIMQIFKFEYRITFNYLIFWSIMDFIFRQVTRFIYNGCRSANKTSNLQRNFICFCHSCFCMFCQNTHAKFKGGRSQTYWKRESLQNTFQRQSFHNFTFKFGQCKNWRSQPGRL